MLFLSSTPRLLIFRLIFILHGGYLLGVNFGLFFAPPPYAGETEGTSETDMARIEEDAKDL